MKLNVARRLASIALHGFIVSTLLTSCDPKPKIIDVQEPQAVQEFYDTVHPDDENKSAPVRFTDAQKTKLRDALVIAKRSIDNPLFKKILKDQSAADVYSWGYGRLDEIDERHHSDPIAFFLSEFQSKGLPNMNQLVARDSYEDDDVTGSTVACSENINFNVDNLNRSSRTPVYVAGTIVHERMHSFCLKHRSNNNTKQYNLCDVAYHAGNLAIILEKYRANQSKPISKPPIAMCKSLVKRLQDENILKK